MLVTLVNNPKYHPYDWCLLAEVKFCPYCGKEAQEVHVVWTTDETAPRMVMLVLHVVPYDPQPCSSGEYKEIGP